MHCTLLYCPVLQMGEGRDGSSHSLAQSLQHLDTAASRPCLLQVLYSILYCLLQVLYSLLYCLLQVQYSIQYCLLQVLYSILYCLLQVRGVHWIQISVFKNQSLELPLSDSSF